MVETRTFDFVFDPETRTKEIFQNLFQEIFLSNSNRELNYEQVKFAFESNMGDDLDDQDHLTIQEIFSHADVDKNGTLSKRELMDVIRKSLDKGLFQNFFTHIDQRFFDDAK
jgi:Ca2+-binding EF-hand superfamily protein